jgi:hypothetical protein
LTKDNWCGGASHAADEGALLTSIALFADNSPAVNWLTDTAFVPNLPAGPVLGDQPEFLYILLSTRDVFITPAVTLGMRYLMSSRVLSDARVPMFPAESFRALAPLKRDPYSVWHQLKCAPYLVGVSKFAIVFEARPPIRRRVHD